MKNILSFFTVGLLISSILRGKTLDAHSRGDQPSYEKKSWALLFITFASLYSFASLKTEEGSPFFEQSTNEFDTQATYL